MSKKILVIDDEQVILQGLKIRLESEGYNVITTADPVDGLEKALLFKPDLIILDVMMPKLSGLEALKVLTQSEKLKNTAIIMLTAVKDRQIVEKVIEMGVVDYCIKPYEWYMLNQKIKIALKTEARPKKNEKELAIDVKIKVDIAVIDLSGSLNVYHIGEMKKTIDAQVEDRVTKQIIDFTNIKETNPLTIHKLINVLKNTPRVDFAIISPNKKITEMLKDFHVERHCGLFLCLPLDLECIPTYL